MITHFTAIASKEIRTLMRSRRAFWFLMLALIGIGGVFVFFWNSQAGWSTLSERARFSRQMFQMTSFTLFCTLGLITPIMTATAFTSEREHKTLDLLACTTIPRLGLLLGKWLAAIVFQVALVICLLPVLSLLFQLGGVGFDEYLFAAGITVLTVATYGMLGLAVSVRMRRSMPAMLWTLGIILFLNFGIPFLLLIFNSFLFLIGDPGWTFFTIVSPLMHFMMKILRDSNPLGGSFSDEYLIFLLHLLFQLAVFFLSAIYASRALARGETLKPVLAKKPIDDPEVLLRRRKSFPYYIVDPLRRPQVIGDDQNPISIKEKHTGSAMRLATIIRLGYAGFLISLPLSCSVHSPDDPSTSMNDLLLFVLSLLVILVPVLGATVISREREEGTLDLLTITPLSANQIVRAKFTTVLRVLVILAACLLTFPLLLQLLLTRNFDETASIWILALPLAASFLAFYAALVVACSSFSRRNATAIVMSYALITVLYLAPFVTSLGHETIAQVRAQGIVFREFEGHGSNVYHFLSYCVCPLFSPITPLVSDENPRWAELFAREWKAFGMISHTVLTALMAWGVLKIASWRMTRRSDER